MEGVNTAILIFIFAALAFPKLVKNKPQFYLALAGVLAVIFLDATSRGINNESFSRFAYCIGGIIQIFAVVLVVMSVGGLSSGEIASEMSGAFEVLRRGETTKETIIPLSAAALKKKTEEQAQRKRRPDDEDKPRETFNLDDPAPAQPPPKRDTGPLPLE